MTDCAPPPPEAAGARARPLTHAKPDSLSVLSGCTGTIGSHTVAGSVLLAALVFGALSPRRAKADVVPWNTYFAPIEERITELLQYDGVGSSGYSDRFTGVARWEDTGEYLPPGSIFWVLTTSDWQPIGRYLSRVHGIVWIDLTGDDMTPTSPPFTDEGARPGDPFKVYYLDGDTFYDTRWVGDTPTYQGNQGHPEIYRDFEVTHNEVPGASTLGLLGAGAATLATTGIRTRRKGQGVRR